MINENNCQNRHEEIAGLVLGELEPQAAKELRKHIGSCQTCQSLYRELVDEEETIRSAFQTIAEKGEDLKSSLIAQLYKKEPAKTNGINWGKIMKSPLIKFAAAAVIIIAVALILHISSFNLTTPAFSFQDVTNAMNNVQWIQSRLVNLSSDSEAIQIYKENNLMGAWTLVNPFRQINIGTVQIIYSEPTLGKEIVFYPKSNLITIAHSGITSKRRYKYLSDFTKENILDYEKAGAKITYKTGRLDGRPVKIINIDTAGATDRMDSNSTWYIDPKTYLPIMIKTNRINGVKRKSNVYRVFNFPEKAPNDIYEAGAPRDAKIKIIHDEYNPWITQTPDVPELFKALRRYNAARDKLLTDYILVTTYEYNSTLRMLDVVYHQGKGPNENQRSICYSARNLIESQFDNGPVVYNFENLLEWSKTQNNDYQSTAIINNGRRFFSSEQGLKDTWITEGKRNWPRGINNLSDWGWPEILPKVNIKETENDYSRENGLIAFEKITKPEIIHGKLMNAAQKDIYYIDPSHDYMCVRKEEYQHFIMGGKGLEDFEFDINELTDEISCVQFVSEFGQTEEGQWYPKRIETHSKSWDAEGNAKPLSISFITTLYLKRNTEFPERFFNPEKPPVPEEKQNASLSGELINGN